MKKLLVVFVFVLSSWVVRGEEEKVSVTMEPMSLSVQPARYQFIKEIVIPNTNKSFTTGEFVSANALIDTEQGRVWVLSLKGKSLTLVPVERADLSPAKP